MEVIFSAIAGGVAGAAVSGLISSLTSFKLYQRNERINRIREIIDNIKHISTLGSMFWTTELSREKISSIRTDIKRLDKHLGIQISELAKENTEFENCINYMGHLRDSIMWDPFDEEDRPLNSTRSQDILRCEFAFLREIWRQRR